GGTQEVVAEIAKTGIKLRLWVPIEETLLEPRLGPGRLRRGHEGEPRRGQGVGRGHIWRQQERNFRGGRDIAAVGRRIRKQKEWGAGGRGRDEHERGVRPAWSCGRTPTKKGGEHSPVGLP